MYLGAAGDRPKCRLLKAELQRAIYFTSRGPDLVRTIDKAAAVANRTIPNTILDLRF